MQCILYQYYTSPSCQSSLVSLVVEQPEEIQTDKDDQKIYQKQVNNRNSRKR